MRNIVLRLHDGSRRAVSPAEECTPPRGASPKLRPSRSANYQHLTIPQVKGRLDDLSKKQIRQVEDYERKHENRKTLVDELENRLKAA